MRNVRTVDLSPGSQVKRIDLAPWARFIVSLYEAPMNVKRAAVLAGVTVKALKYYEAIGLVQAARLANGYRDFSLQDVEIVKQVKDLTRAGLSVNGTRPFIECLRQGHIHSDDCPESLAAYRNEIQRLGCLVMELTSRRQMLQQRLQSAASRGLAPPEERDTATHMIERYGLPEDLPVPADDGSAAHLPGRTLPALSLLSTDGSRVTLSEVTEGRWLIFVYPTTGVPGEDLPMGWDQIPGARGCTPEACGFRDNFGELLNVGLGAIYGLSSQQSGYQHELVERLRLPYPMLSDPSFSFGKSLHLPTFRAGGSTFYKRLTMVIRHRTIEHVFFPIFPPNEHARNVLKWIRSQPS
jgi:peroxiredoxin/DNA-binding transcriptional MerR regulator